MPLHQLKNPHSAKEASSCFRPGNRQPQNVNIKTGNGSRCRTNTHTQIHIRSECRALVMIISPRHIHRLTSVRVFGIYDLFGFSFFGILRLFLMHNVSGFHVYALRIKRLILHQIISFVVNKITSMSPFRVGLGIKTNTETKENAQDRSQYPYMIQKQQIKPGSELSCSSVAAVYEDCSKCIANFVFLKNIILFMNIKPFQNNQLKI